MMTSHAKTIKFGSSYIDKTLLSQTMRSVPGKKLFEVYYDLEELEPSYVPS